MSASSEAPVQPDHQDLQKNAATPALDVEAIRRHFPILSRRVQGRPLIYLDSAATTQKPESVIQAEADYYRQHNANVHRGIHTLAEEATALYEGTRDLVARTLGGVPREEVVFTRGTTEAINLLADAWARDRLGPGRRIVLTRMEHHANLVPWLQLARRTGAEISYIELTPEGELDLESAEAVIQGGDTVLVAMTHMSNVLGTINPVSEIAEMARKAGARLFVDGAQGAPHLPVNPLELGADAYAFSAHKMLGPTGVGVLWARRELLEEMEPYQTGGEMIQLVRWDRVTWADLPHRFEAGTPNIAGVAAFAKALEFLTDLGMETVRQHEEEWTAYALDTLGELGFVKIFGPRDPKKRGAAISFDVEGVHPHDLAQLLDQRGIAVRAGHHCAQPLTRMLGLTATTRASAYVYNTLEEVDALREGLLAARDYFAA